MFVPILAILGAFLLPMYIAKLRHEEKKARLQLEAKARGLIGSGGGGGDDAAVKRLTDENKLLRERVENLESIVCSVDFDLNQKLARLIDDHRSLMLPGGLAPALAPAAAALASPAAAPARPATGEGAASGGSGSASPVDAAAVTVAPPSPVPSPAARPDLREQTVTSISPPGTRPSASTALEPGQILAQRYRIQRLLGKGGMGAVYLADDEVLSELVALKVISSAFSADESAMIARFRREAAAARKVSSPSVIRIHDLGEARPGLLYLSMEYFAGRTLAELIAQRGTVPLDDARDILKQISTGLEAAHQAGVIHRDLKPSNVLIGERGAVKIIDFGLATTAMAEGLTATGAVLGTPHYMAPEQVRGKSVDARTDIYALGALAYHLLCGRPPFTGDNAIAIGFAHLSETPVSPRLLRKDCPPALEAAILGALAKAPEDRPASARAFLEKATAASAA